MKTRTLRNGVAFTELGLGASQFGNLGRETRDDEVASAVEAAWAAGIRYFDTAPHYGLGLSEKRLGMTLAAHRRDDYILSTKVGRLIVADPAGADRQDDAGFVVSADRRRVWDFSTDGVRRSIDESLERLGMDRLDIAYLHDPDDHFDEAVEQAIPALVSLRDEGTIGAIGVGMNQSRMLTEFVRRADVDVVMCAGRYTLLEQGAASDLLPIARDRGVGVVIAGVYNSGLLSRTRPALAAMYNYAPAPPALIARAHELADICEAHGVTLPEAAVAFPLRHPAVVSIVVGCRDGAQVEEGVKRYNTTVPESLWSDLAVAGLLIA